MYDYLIVGAGITGCTLAERLANEHKKLVLIIDKRDHIGGNSYDCYNDDGILIHKYGPHIFHSNIQEVWDYLSQFTEWLPYQHKVMAFVEGKLVPLPINLDTVNLLLGTDFDENTIHDYFDSVRVHKDEIRNSEEMVTSKVGQELFEKLYRNYTKKQWDLYPAELAPEVTARLPVRTNRESRYFTDQYQGMPQNGYTRMFEAMLASERITVRLNTDFKTEGKNISCRNLIYTGPIDEYYDFCVGPLPYRSLRFDFETINAEKFQPVAVVNYPNDHDYTRITEYKHMTGQHHPKTTVSREFAKAEGDPYYPVPRPQNQELYEQYQALAGRETNVFFAGRLGRYRYLNMDTAVHEALLLVDALTTSRNI